MSTWYDSKTQCLVEIPSSQLARIARIVATRHPRESGGALLGMRRGRHIEVTNITTPARGDSASRFHFLRRDKRHQLKTNWLWRRSGGFVDHVGEWHTHDEMVPRPSPTDSTGWKGLGLRRRGQVMVFLICGQKADRCWVTEGKVVRELKRIE